jgi:arsenite methyltransferase
MKDTEPGEIRESVRKRYGEIAHQKPSCGCGPPSCCGGPAAVPDGSSALRVGYSRQDLEIAPKGSELGLGCGNPQAVADLQPGEIVLDLGSGAGFDSFLAAKKVGPSGHVIGVDMTPEMLEKARELAKNDSYPNVEFRLGEIENLPLADASVDVIISNCVINLSTDKLRVFREAFRVLKPGGRLAISDIVAIGELPDNIRRDLDLYASCVSGAISLAEIEGMLQQSGFQDIRIRCKDRSGELISAWAKAGNIKDLIASASIEAVKPMQ